MRHEAGFRKLAPAGRCLVIVFLILAGSLATTGSQPPHRVYLAMIPHRPFPSCHRTGSIGIAWLDRTGAGAQNYLDRYCASMYYNSSQGTYADLDPDEVPLIWCNRPTDYTKMGTIPSWWNGFLILMNEPGTPGQCTASDPLAAAAIYDEMKDLAPSQAKAVSPNLIVQHQGAGVHGTGWLVAFLNQVVALRGSCDLFAVGIHIYGATSYAPGTKMNWVIAAVDSTACAGKPIIITEYGAHPGEDAFQIMSDVTYLNGNSRVIATFGYTPINASSAIPWEEQGPVTGIGLTESGWGLFDGYRRLGILD